MSWKETLEQYLAERRKRFAGPPSTESMIRMREADLPDEERDRILEQAAVDPEVARQLFDVLRFPEMSRDEDESEPGFDIEDQLAAVRRRLGREGLRREEEHRRTRTDFRWFRFAVPVAALLSLLVGAFFLSPFRLVYDKRPELGSEALLNLAVAELAPAEFLDGTWRSSSKSTIPCAGEGIVVSLSVPGLRPHPEAGSFSLAIQDEQAGDPTILEGLLPGLGGVFVLALPRGVLVGGANQLTLRDSRGDEVARFVLTVNLEC